MSIVKSKIGERGIYSSRDMRLLYVDNYYTRNSLRNTRERVYLKIDNLTLYAISLSLENFFSL